MSRAAGGTRSLSADLSMLHSPRPHGQLCPPLGSPVALPLAEPEGPGSLAVEPRWVGPGKA